MTQFLTEHEIVAAVPRLDPQLLVLFVEAEIIVPLQSERGPVFRPMDVVRVELACDLREQFDLHEDALGMVLSLVDRLHGVRAELKAVLNALEGEAPDIRNRICETVVMARSGD